MEKISNEQLENWFTYHSPTADQQVAYLAIRQAGLSMAKTVRDNCPPCADTTAAIRKIRETVMTANQAIACDGK